MKAETRVTMAAPRKQGTMNALRSALAVLVVGSALYAHDSNAVLLLANDTDDVEWYIGQPAPSVNMASEGFVVVGCGAELGWIYDHFPTIATRTITVPAAQKRVLAVVAAPAYNECVIWRGDNALFIADNLTITPR